jgi:hypothetical protein
LPIVFDGISGNGDSLYDIINYALGATGAGLNTITAGLTDERAALVAGKYSRKAAAILPLLI